MDRVAADCPIFDKVLIRIKDRLADTPARNLDHDIDSDLKK